MNRIIRSFSLAIAIIGIASSCAQPYKLSQKPKNYLEAEQMPDASRFLPSPPVRLIGAGPPSNCS